MYMRVHDTPKGRIVAACDRELIGQVLDDGKIYLDLDKHRDFYQGKLSGKEALKEELKKFSSANLVGKKAVETALELQLLEKNAIMYINKIPHIQLYKI